MDNNCKPSAISFALAAVTKSFKFKKTIKEPSKEKTISKVQVKILATSQKNDIAKIKDLHNLFQVRMLRTDYK